MTLRLKLYAFLVNRRPEISVCYHAVHDGTSGLRKLYSWGYLLWLNICSLITFGRYPEPEAGMFPKKRPPRGKSESEAFFERHPELERERLKERLKSFDLISFDLFDTLLLRPFAQPSDLFFLIGAEMGIPGFPEKRRLAEERAREERIHSGSGAEVRLSEIWEILSSEMAISAEEGMKLECSVEERLCFPSPRGRFLWEEAGKQGLRRVVVSDMYLPKEFLRQLLVRDGFTGFEEIFVSCEYGCSKAEGGLFEKVKKHFFTSAVSCAEKPSRAPRILHIGDNPVSDGKRAKEHGLSVLLLPNVNAAGRDYRGRDMSAIMGSVFRGIVNARLYGSMEACSRYYEYGFISGGLFVLGFCTWLHRLKKEQGLDKLLFLSRDGELLKRVYDSLYPDEDTEYVYWSRKAGTKLCAGLDRAAFFERFVEQKVGGGYSLHAVLRTMELEWLSPWLKASEEPLTKENVPALKELLTTHWEEILSFYAPQDKATKRVLQKVLSGCKRAGVADIGWEGTGPLSLRLLAKKRWGLSCELIGLLAGTKALRSPSPDASEAFLQSGVLFSYLFSQSHNKELFKLHDPGAGFNLLAELFLSSSEPPFKGYYPGDARETPLDRYLPGEDISLLFDAPEKNTLGIMEIRNGILDFIQAFRETFAEYSFMLDISGRDAYAPILMAAGKGGRYAKRILKDFALRTLVE